MRDGSIYMVEELLNSFNIFMIFQKCVNMNLCKGNNKTLLMSLIYSVNVSLLGSYLLFKNDVTFRYVIMDSG